MTGKHWTKRWKHLVAPTALPGVWRMKEGGHLVRVRVVDPTTGRMKEIKKVLAHADATAAYQWLAEEKRRIREGAVSAQPRRQRFADFAVTVYERKVARGRIRSAAGREKWKHTLEHLIAGTKGVVGFGELFMDQLKTHHIEAWQLGIARLIDAGDYAPTTANGWLAILRLVLKAATRDAELGVASNPADGIEPFDTSEHVTYTEEEPNSLTPEEARRFLACMRASFPQHYGMTYLGFATGLRPSSMRPIRRRGATPDVLWDDGAILIRRSHTVGEDVMERTKTGYRQRIAAPAELLDVLRWHVDTQLMTPEQEASDLLFPADDGGLRSTSCLKKVFAQVGVLIGLEKKFTPRGLRRTFNDFARLAEVEAFVTMSISGHRTERMRDRYSTVQPVEQRESIGRLLRLVEGGSGAPSKAGGAPGGAPTAAGGAPREKVAG